MSFDSEIKRLKENLRKLNSEISAANRKSRKSSKCPNIKVLNDKFKRLSDELLNINKRAYRCQKETMKLK